MIGIIGALDIEVAELCELMKNKKEKEISNILFTEGEIEGVKCVAAVCGVGKVNAAICATAMIINYNPDCIINSGVAGGLKHGIGIGDIVVADNVVQHDADSTAAGIPLGGVQINDETVINIPCDSTIANRLFQSCQSLADISVFLGTIVTGDQFIEGKEKRKELHDNFNALACEMEGGAIGHVCYKHKIPFGVLRAISDDMENDEFVDFAEFAPKAAANSIAAIRAFLHEI
ncbi:MAG: 5'-methylthioadenosine/adenosylhomocysteine nucleosidase [Bacillota bacterium]|nr:5'-methylthioadenosine/adenosylhomocysteine nucleosidase [Bacillota bacterium]